MPELTGDAVDAMRADAARDLATTLATLHELTITAVIAAVMARDSPFTTSAESLAAVRREIEWQYYWIRKNEAAELELGQVRRQLGTTALTRLHAVLALTDDVRPGGGRHDDDCYRHRHAGCLAAKIRDLLTGEVPGA
jgi:hypothetical protein